MVQPYMKMLIHIHYTQQTKQSLIISKSNFFIIRQKVEKVLRFDDGGEDLGQWVLIDVDKRC